ncbi:LOW QUALITY PROTEIN: hypothetical protein OSB04_014883 [Centaurea solstitialis]|uniref:Pentatricopeptide repeat-containing protein n=1 Tax=Centaurea solstitialis TaxID=347529 RepID=A0AA38THV0_9ASTR|nr:LOW QUALITY PROTEIN: hypothetical protein OSB04_014883 [Centaurea solstitialis]
MSCTSEGFAIVGYGFKGFVQSNFTFSTLLNGLILEDGILDAERLKLIKGKLCEPNVVVYDTMINGLYKLGNNDSAIGWLRLMDERGCKPDIITYNVRIDSLWTVGETRPISWQGNPNDVAAMVVFDPLCLIKKGAYQLLLKMYRSCDDVLLQLTFPLKEYEAISEGMKTMVVIIKAVMILFCISHFPTIGFWASGESRPVSWRGNPDDVAAMAVFDPLCSIQDLQI